MAIAFDAGQGNDGAIQIDDLIIGIFLRRSTLCLGQDGAPMDMARESGDHQRGPVEQRREE
jgi:hypothetical protein